MRENVGFADETRVDTRHLQHLVARKPWLADFAFLIRSDADIEALLDAEHEAGQSGVDLLTALFTVNRITPHRYTEALAAVLEIPAAGYDISFDQNGPRGCFTQPGAVATPIFGYWRGTPALIVCATDAFPRVVATRVASARSGAPVVVLVAARPLQSAVELACAAINVKAATFGLKRSQPLFSAGRAGPQWQPIIIAVGIGLVAGSATANPQGTLAIFTLLLTVPFLGTVLVRLMALVGLLFRSPGLQPAAPRIPDRELPIYSFMVALYDEADVLPTLIAALTNLDYPATKLDGLLVIEDGDFATKAALLEIALPAFMRVVVVPDGELRTKPRALNYALALARGVYVVIYDAEDRPEPDQLRRALAAFRTAADTGSGTQQLACVQACLNIYNARQSWLTRQFTVEYSALFDSVLPTLQRLRMPMPLGGTSNHFPRRVLAELRGWDPYNVTEDADLGIRIARLGHRVTMISSTTWEEAPATFNLWLKQRTRWLKGWMQTYLVHTRQPLALLRDLGFFRTLGFHLYLGGLILSALVHPLFYAAIVAEYALDIRPEGLGPTLGPVLWTLSVGNLAVGYLASIVVGMLATRRRGHRLAFSALLMPLYWLLISLAAYRALWQLYSDPFLWEKTPHGHAEED